MFVQAYFRDAAKSQTVPQHHRKAAAHLDIAARAYRDAAGLIESGDHQAAELHVRMARDNVLNAGMQVIAAGRKSEPAGLFEIR